MKLSYAALLLVIVLTLVSSINARREKPKKHGRKKSYLGQAYDVVNRFDGARTIYDTLGIHQGHNKERTFWPIDSRPEFELPDINLDLNGEITADKVREIIAAAVNSSPDDYEHLQALLEKGIATAINGQYNGDPDWQPTDWDWRGNGWDSQTTDWIDVDWQPDENSESWDDITWNWVTDESSESSESSESDSEERGWWSSSDESSDSESSDVSSSSEDDDDSMKNSKSSEHKHGKGKGSKEHKHDKGSKEHKHDKGKGSKEHKHGKRSKEHKPGKGSREKKHSHSHSHSEESEGSWEWWESGSWDRASLESSSEEREVTNKWCINYCLNWIEKNSDDFFSDAAIQVLLEQENIIKTYCKSIAKISGCMPGVVWNETTTTTTPAPTTTRPAVRYCSNSMGCMEEECCSPAGYNLFGVSRSQPICQRLSDNGDRCASASYMRRNDQIYRACPCSEGLECQSWLGTRTTSAFVVGRCHRITGWTSPTTTTTTTESPTTTRTIKESMVTGTVGQNTTLENSTDIPPAVNETGVITPCNNHMDCPFFQCCLNATSVSGEASSGYCKPFSSEEDSCNTLDSFMELPVVNACPCQSFLKCRKEAASAAYGTCV